MKHNWKHLTRLALIVAAALSAGAAAATWATMQDRAAVAEAVGIPQRTISFYEREAGAIPDRLLRAPLA